MTDRSRHQDRIIRNYYRNRESIAEQRVQELITDIFLASGKKRDRCWEHLATHLRVLGMRDEQIDHLRSLDRPDVLARAVNRLLNKQA